MADISEWSTVDESNTAAPPNGWPEGQATNTVNNCARAMMGAVRRWYDTVTAELAALRSSIANYLPLAGGTVTGILSAPQYNLSGVAFANRDAAVNYHYVYDADGIDPALILGGAAAGFQSIYRAETHYIQSNTGAITFATFNVSGMALTGSVNVTSGISAGGSIAGNVLIGNAVSSNGDITATDTLRGDAVVCLGNCEAFSYTRNGVPMVMLSQTQLDRIEARIAALETQKVAA